MNQRGAATPLLVGITAAFVMLALMLNVIGAVVVGHRRAGAAADLAALAGATAVQHGRDGCATAAHMANLNDARLVSCNVADQVVTVSIEKPLPEMFGRQIAVRAAARAGPQ